MQEFEVAEFKSEFIPLELLSNSDLRYLDNISISQKKFTLTPHEKESLFEVHNTYYAGVIELSKIRLYFGSKVETDLIYMLHYLRREEDFFIDPNKEINLQEGDIFFDFIGKLFLRELDELSKKGLLRNYLHQEELQSFVRGSIDFSKQWKNNITHNGKLCCRWDELTYDSLENQLILQAIRHIIPEIIHDEETRFELQQHFVQLLDLEISLTDLGPGECDRVVFSRMNESYVKIMPWVRIILERCFIRSESKGKAKGYNFLVNMNQLFEDLVTEVAQKVILHKYRDYSVIPQETIENLVIEKTIDIRPDILLQNRHTKEHEYIMDAKYKYSADNSNYYQMIAYSIAIPSAKKGMMIFPESERELLKCVTVQDPYRSDGREVKILCESIPLMYGDKITFRQYKKNLEERMDQIFGELIESKVEDNLYKHSQDRENHPQSHLQKSFRGEL